MTGDPKRQKSNSNCSIITIPHGIYFVSICPQVIYIRLCWFIKFPDFDSAPLVFAYRASSDLFVHKNNVLNIEQVHILECNLLCRWEQNEELGAQPPTMDLQFQLITLQFFCPCIQQQWEDVADYPDAFMMCTESSILFLAGGGTRGICLGPRWTLSAVWIRNTGLDIKISGFLFPTLPLIAVWCFQFASNNI